MAVISVWAVQRVQMYHSFRRLHSFETQLGLTDAVIRKLMLYSPVMHYDSAD